VSPQEIAVELMARGTTVRNVLASIASIEGSTGFTYAHLGALWSPLVVREFAKASGGELCVHKWEPDGTRIVAAYWRRDSVDVIVQGVETREQAQLAGVSP
jgi:hypothetical protein